MATTRFDLAAYDAVQENRVAELLQRLSNECSAAGLSFAIEIESCAKDVRRITGEREKPFRAT